MWSSNLLRTHTHAHKRFSVNRLIEQIEFNFDVALQLKADNLDRWPEWPIPQIELNFRRNRRQGRQHTTMIGQIPDLIGGNWSASKWSSLFKLKLKCTRWGDEMNNFWWQAPEANSLHFDKVSFIRGGTLFSFFSVWQNRLFRLLGCIPFAISLFLNTNFMFI